MDDECEDCGILGDEMPLILVDGVLLCVYCREARRLASEAEFEED